jgi:pimeloyl-ACP methyl ester carboxylesterase
MMDRTSEVVTVGEVTIETYIDGSGGPDVVLLPSYGRDGGDDFDPLTAVLADSGFRVLRPQPRGIARSRGPMTGVTLDDQGDDIARMLDKLGRGPAVILGHAYGNFIARVLATNHPEKVSAVILAAASGHTVTPAVNAAPFRAGDPGLSEDERLAALRLAFFAPGHDPSAWLTGWYPQTLATQHASVTAAGAALKRYWTAGRAPVFEIIAALDPFHRRNEWPDLRSQLGSRVTTTVIEGASHALFPEQPAAVAHAVVGYLKTLPYAEPGN